ncbi:MAG: RNA polymerase sigma factor [Rhodobacteraceae bacterium]|nr:RNA polymerase sigma factor [Paracoccaceae bacterium]
MRTLPRSVPAPGDDRPEAELVALARSKDEAAIRELIRRCNRQLFRVARGILHNDSEAEDVVQATYVSAFTKLEGFRGEATFATWLTRIAMNEAYGRLRRQARIVNLSEYRKEVEKGITNTMRPPPTTPEAELGRAEMHAFLEQAIDALPEPLRLTYVLHDVQEMTTREVADLLAVNPITVKTRLFRARRRLRDVIRRNLATDFSGVFPFDGARCAGMADRVVRALSGASEG